MIKVKKNKRASNYDDKQMIMTAERDAPKTALSNDLSDPSGSDPSARICVRNWMVPNGINLFPTNVKFRIIDKHYPYAQGGPLLVDEVNYESDVPEYKEKAKTLQDLDIRYLFIKPNADLFETMKVLNELDHKRNRATTPAE